MYTLVFLYPYFYEGNFSYLFRITKKERLPGVYTGQPLSSCCNKNLGEDYFAKSLNSSYPRSGVNPSWTTA
jgi:hypothetical protein